MMNIKPIKKINKGVNNELMTEREMKKWGFPFTNNFIPVEIKKTETYWFFGSRFEIK